VVYTPEGFALQIFQSRHASHENETWLEACERVAVAVSNAEQGEARAKWRERFYDVLSENLLMPGGRIWSGAGRARGQLLNCFVIPTGDSREGWGKTLYDSVVISGTGGGVGLNCSPVRPRGSMIRGTGGVATGAVSLMQAVDSCGEVIKAGGGRRTALMLCLSLSHGDVVEFLDKKLDLGELNNANVSVVFDEDPDAFFELVRADKDFPLTFQGKQVGSIPAKELWMRIVTNALRGGEPGLLNGYLANKMSNIWYLEKLTSTNPCGEIWMSPYDCCCLGALVLPRFRSTNPSDNSIDWALLRRTIKTAVRFLDDVLDVNNYPLPEIKAKCNQLRRIGLGVTGLHDLLLELGYQYNSPEGLEFVDKLMKFIKNESYEASIDLAAEKGSFPAFDGEKVLKSAFIKTLKPSIRQRILETGLRNCALNTIAPTGTISIVCGVSSGIEPIFAAAYERTYRKGDELAKETVVHPLFQQFVAAGRSTKHFQGAHDLKIKDHFEMQLVCQRHVDNAVSKTINVPAGTSPEELSDLYMEFFPALKGVTIYPDGSRENQPLRPLSNEVAEEYAFSATLGASGNDSCKSGACDV
jgi:ribonucleoside-diphosphate reductase alpha chain